MAQQINLLTPILLKPRRHFTATAMVQALLLILLGSLLLSAWIHSRAGQRSAELQARLQALQAEQQALGASLASLPAATDLKAVEAQIQTLSQQQGAQEALLLSLRGGRQMAGERHSDLLRLIASTVPNDVWLQGLRWQSGRLELSGGTLDPSSLRSWLARLQDQALLHRIAMAELQMEMVTAPGMSGQTDGTLSSRLQIPAGTTQPVWAFQARGSEPGLGKPETGARP